MRADNVLANWWLCALHKNTGNKSVACELELLGQINGKVCNEISVTVVKFDFISAKKKKKILLGGNTW